MVIKQYSKKAIICHYLPYSLEDLDSLSKTCTMENHPHL